MKKTAVEWLIRELNEYGLINKDMLPSHPIFNKAKQLEKQQIIDAYKYSTSQFSVDARIDYPKSGEKYYNETYNK
jgi:hypothetical protein